MFLCVCYIFFRKFNVFLEGEFIFYRHKTLSYAVSCVTDSFYCLENIHISSILSLHKQLCDSEIICNVAYACVLAYEVLVRLRLFLIL